MIPLPYPPKLVQKTGNLGIFEIEALYPGYGVTMGNALRRVLLSSLSGAAITWVKISGAPHEFSTIQHVREDVIQIVMNLKKLRFILHADEPQTIRLFVKGEREVKGGDFELSSQVELVGKDTHIATLTDKSAEFEIEAQVEKGLGYVPREELTKEKSDIGIIRLDALFSPIKRVSFQVEQMRVQDRTDYDRLMLEVETDGTVSPERAMFEAGEILRSFFHLISSSFADVPLHEEAANGNGASGEKSVEKEEVEGDVGKTKIESLDLSTRTMNALLKNKVKTAGGLTKKSETSLLEMEGMGESGVKEIKKALKKLGLELKA